jgi:hypothetical protein
MGSFYHNFPNASSLFSNILNKSMTDALFTEKAKQPAPPV